LFWGFFFSLNRREKTPEKKKNRRIKKNTQAYLYKKQKDK